MPRGDGTGPAGFGPMTGRSAGYCAGYDAPGFVDAPGARGRAGAGRGYRRMYYATGLPGWMRYGCRGWVAREVALGSARPAAGFRGVPYEGRYASDDAGMSEEREKQLLSQQAQFLRSELEVVERRISDMASPDRGSTEGGK